MRIDRLDLVNFLGHAHWSYRCPVSDTAVFFTGPHGSGKTSVAHAISVALVGTARGVTRKDRYQLGRGQDGFTVRLQGEHAGANIVATAAPTSQSPGTQALQRALGATPTLLLCLLDWSAWASLDGEKRRRMLLELSEAKLSDNPKLPAELNLVRRSGGVAAALRKATESRLALMRTLKEFADVSPPDPAVTFRGKVYSMAAMDRAGLTTKLRGAKDASRKALRRLMDASSLEKSSGDRLAELQLRASDVPSLRARQTELASEFDAASSAAAARLATSRDLGSKRAVLRAEHSAMRVVTGKVKCDRCGASGCECFAGWRGEAVDMERELGKELENVGQLYAAAAAEAEDLQGAVAKIGSSRRDVTLQLEAAQVAEREAARLGAARDAATEQGLDPDSAQVEVDALAERVSAMEQALVAFDRWAAASEVYADQQARLDRIRVDHDLYVQAEALLKLELRDGGGDAVVLIGERAARYASIWQRGELTLDDDVLPRLAGRPYGLLSRAEQYMASLAVVAALAHVSGVRFCIFDDADMLTKNMRKVLAGWLAGPLAVDLDQVICFGASDVPTSAQIGTLAVRPLVA